MRSRLPHAPAWQAGLLVLMMSWAMADEAIAQAGAPPAEGDVTPAQSEEVVDRSKEPMPSYLEPLPQGSIVTSQPSVVREPRTGRGLRIAGYIIVAISALGVGFGVACLADPTEPDPEAPPDDSIAGCFNGVVYGPVLLAVGVAMLVAGYNRKAAHKRWQAEQTRKPLPPSRVTLSPQLRIAF